MLHAGRNLSLASGNEAIHRIPPYFYVHVLDQNSNVTKLEIGPQTYILQNHERLVLLD